MSSPQAAEQGNGGKQPLNEKQQEPQDQKPRPQPQQQRQQSKGAKRAVLKVAKGTTDYKPEQMAIRDEVFETVKRVYRRHGAVTIETPVFELKETLTSKYGEDSKLIYDLEDQGGELCALRYDLTVPFARYCAMYRVQQIKRYHIARVYRRDNPVMSKGRYREFYQCDFDIAGEYDLMLPDAEVIRTMCEVLDEVKVGTYVIKLNHRRLLDGYFAICGVPEDKFRTISSAVDKLDKAPWEEVRKEMVEEKGLDEDVADRIKEYVVLCGNPMELLVVLRERKLCDGDKRAVQALDELETLFTYCEAYGVLDRISFDLSLARGLDYYTGVIYEAVLTEGTAQVGSIAAGGRYDTLIGMFGKKEIPAVGFSLGIERCFAILEKRYAAAKLQVRATQTDVCVCTMEQKSQAMLEERLKICRELWDAGLKAETLPKTSPKIQQQLKYAETNAIPLAVVFGQTEIDNGVVLVKIMAKSEQVEVPRAEMIPTIQKMIEQIAANTETELAGGKAE